MAKPTLPTYTDTLSQALEAIESVCVTAKGSAFKDKDAWDNHWMYGGIPYETTKTGNFELVNNKGKRKYLTVTLYRTQGGRYEVIAYVS